MNAKKAKQLRRIARKETINLPMRDYEVVPGSERDKVTLTFDGSPRYFKTCTIRLGDCTRAYYKMLKKRS